MTEVVTVNLKRCENCGVCEMACAERYDGKARLKVKDVLQSRGLIFEDEALPIVCKQCETPACLEVCKPKAIARENGVISIDENKCIGCGRCVKSCAFSAIFIEESPSAQMPEARERSVLSMLFDRRTTSDDSERTQKRKTTRKVYKCDRCKGYGNMACVDACYFRALSKRELSTLKNGKPEHLALLEQRLSKKEAVSET